MSKGSFPARSNVLKLLKEIKARIEQAQTRAVLSVNIDLVRLYWDIGRLIATRQQKEGWGAGVIPRLARELHNELPEEKGFSERNIGRMIAFFRAYPDPSSILPQPVAKLTTPPTAKQNSEKTPPFPILPQPVAKLPARAKFKQYSEKTAPSPILPQAVAKLPRGSKSPPEFHETALPDESIIWLIPWGHHALLLDKLDDQQVRAWYMAETLANGWSRNVLLLMIKSESHLRRGRAITNFERLLPAPQSDLIRQALKDPYILDFLTIDEPFKERELETTLLHQMERFLLELGQGFAFVGRQFHVDVGGRDFYIDLLFYHLALRCYVVIDLKKGEFKPEYAGKMNFYLEVVDDRLRHSADAPTIGLILCQDRNHVVAEYALRASKKPIGVSEYELTRALPAGLRSALPTVEQIEAELGELKVELPVRSGRPAKKKSKKAAGKR